MPPSPWPSSDRHVSARAILRAVAQVQRQGEPRAMQRLEELEPDLAEFVLERLSLVHRHLHALGAPPKRTGKVYGQVQLLVLVTVEALRQSQLELWAELAEGEQRLGRLDAPEGPPPDGKPPPPPPP